MAQSPWSLTGSRTKQIRLIGDPDLNESNPVGDYNPNWDGSYEGTGVPEYAQARMDEINAKNKAAAEKDAKVTGATIKPVRSYTSAYTVLPPGLSWGSLKGRGPGGRDGRDGRNGSGPAEPQLKAVTAPSMMTPEVEAVLRDWTS